MSAATLQATRSPPRTPLQDPAEPQSPRRRAKFLADRERRLRTHRVCDPQDAAYVFRMCLVDPSILPRHHQRDRGKRPEAQGVHRQAAQGSYCGVLAWRSGRMGWLGDLAVASSLRPEVRKSLEVSSAELAACAQVLSGYVQDKRTGRRCIVTPATVASVLISRREGCLVHKRTVFRCLAVMRELGFLVTIGERGRRLNLEEKAQAQRGHSQQSGFSTERALTNPAPVADSPVFATPSKGTATTSESGLGFPFLHGAQAEQKEATPSPLRKRGPPRSSPARELAEKVVKLYPWLSSESPRRLEGVLKPFVECQPPWNEHEIHDAIEKSLEVRGMVRAITVEKIRTRPARMFAGLLKHVDPNADHPSLEPVRPAELRCGRPECDHGWLVDPDDQVRELLGIPPNPQRKCDQCRPGAWPQPTYEELEGELDEEPPF